MDFNKMWLLENLVHSCVLRHVCAIISITFDLGLLGLSVQRNRSIWHKGIDDWTVTVFPFVQFVIWCFFLFCENQRKYGDHFRGFLEGTDALWALEDDISLSVINIMALVDVTQMVHLQNDSHTELLNSFRRRISERLITNPNEFAKIFYKRCEENGFPFWTNENNCDIEEYIR